MTALNFELVSPERLLVSRPVGMVIVPGEEGDFGVLPGHAPVIAALRPGLLHIYEDGVLKDSIFVAGGFAEVTAERCTVLAEDAAPVAELDRKVIEAEQAKLCEELAVRAEAESRARIEKRLAALAQKLKAMDEKVYH